MLFLFSGVYNCALGLRKGYSLPINTSFDCLKNDVMKKIAFLELV